MLLLSRRKKSGMITIEFILVLFFAAVTLFIILGVFYDNVNKMADNGNIQKITGKNSAKTDYQSFGRNYSNSKVYVK
jgi:hypothetical protein